ncbi:hypothetical protein [Thalassotalea sp. PS06]|uniref:hypothetical protein n=1 Tax=Thalassotalea sp. PS06 TaxID=2594005 RepID=UPI001163AE2A|nr:hypothetical protein [Thalassotalea sp. PS06]QDP02560.1 hypothetical protein FNC98_15095 [Thalassotalea sp. PS06]
MSLIRNILIVFAISLTASCASKVTSIKDDVDDKLQETEGYLLIAVDTNVGLNEILISGENYIKLTAQDLRSGTNYILINLPEGEYEIQRIKLNDWYYIDHFEDELWSFKVEKDVISYVGHLDIQTGGWWSRYSEVELLNKSSMALEFMQEEFSSILANRNLKYHGPGDDEFFKIVGFNKTKEAS